MQLKLESGNCIQNIAEKQRYIATILNANEAG